MFTRRKRFNWPALAGLALILVILVLAGWLIRPYLSSAPLTPTATPLAPRWTPGWLEIRLLDVKHGDAQLIISPTGEAMLIDCGRVEYVDKVASYISAVLGRLAVDYLMASHYHIDHIGGCPGLLRKGLRVRRAVLDRGGERTEYDSPEYRDYYDTIVNATPPLLRVRLHEGDSIDLGPHVALQVLTVGDIDTRTASGVAVVGENDNSIGVWLTFGLFDYWTGGDLSGVNSIKYADIETAVAAKLPRQADAFKANHHAINYNNNQVFLAALRPTVSLVSSSHEVVGWDCILRLEQISDVYITGQIPAHKAYGDIVLASKDGTTFTVEGKVYFSKK